MSKTADNFSVRNLTKGKPPRLPFKLAKNLTLGEKYDLSLVFVSESESKSLNKKYRGKDKPANVLSFPLSKNAGEMVICLKEARRDAPRFNMGYPSFVALLFIHGLLHLKGMRHGSKMEGKEKEILKKLIIN